MPIHLVVVEGKPLGAVIPLKTDPFLIGKAPGCQLRPRGAEVADRQCAIFRRGPHVTVRDLGGTPGTLVNDRCLKGGDEARVGDGDRLQVGQLIFAIRIEPEDPASAAPIDDVLSALGAQGLGPGAGLSGFFPGQSGVYLSPRNGPKVPTPVGILSSPRIPTPPPADALTVAFASRDLDPESGAICLGISPAQVAEEPDRRALRKSLRELVLARRPCRLVLDLSGLDPIPSLTLATLIGLARRCEADGGELRLCAASPQGRRQLHQLRFDDVAALYDHRDEAYADAWDG